MFILYINDINSDTCSSIRLFADDCLLYRVVECTHDAAKLQGDLTQLSRSARDWQMDFNASKCHVLSISRKQKPVLFPYTISGVQLECVCHHPYLGVELSSDCKIPAYIQPYSTPLRVSHDQQYRVPHTTNPIDAHTYPFFPGTISIWNLLPAALVHESTIEGFKNGLHKEFLSGNIFVVSPRGQCDWPRLGSSASLPVVGPVY